MTARLFSLNIYVNMIEVLRLAGSLMKSNFNFHYKNCIKGLIAYRFSEQDFNFTRLLRGQ